MCPSRRNVSSISCNDLSVTPAKRTSCFMTPRSRFLTCKRIAVKEPEQCYLLAIRLKLCGHRVGHEAAKGPAEQVVRSDRLDLANKAQVVGGHVLEGPGKYIPLNKIARLQPIDRVA